MDDTLMWVLLCVWLINMVVTVLCTAQIGLDLERMEQIWKEMQEADHGKCEKRI